MTAKNKYKSKSVRLADTLMSDICASTVCSNGYLHSEEALALRYDVSRSTIRNTIDILGQKGVLIKKPNRGSQIAPGLVARAQNADAAPAARSVNAKRICAVWAGFPDAFIVGISQGAQDYARAHDLDFQIIQSHEDHRRILDELTHIREHGATGLIILPYNFPGYVEALRHLRAQGFPLVCVDRPPEGLELSWVGVDNCGGVYAAVVSMATAARRMVHYFGADPAAYTQRMRYNGYCQAMVDCGFGDDIAAATHFYPAADHDPHAWSMEKKVELPTRTARRFLATANFPLSVMAMNDYAARGLYTAAAELGRVVGEDMLVFGFDDLPLAALLDPPLSSVRQPRHDIGYEAARLLHEEIQGKIVRPVNRLLPVESIERASSRPARASLNEAAGATD